MPDAAARARTRLAGAIELTWVCAIAILVGAIELSLVGASAKLVGAITLLPAGAIETLASAIAKLVGGITSARPRSHGQTSEAVALTGARGIGEVLDYEGSEISVKGAGGPTCLTRPLVREYDSPVQSN